MPPLTTWPSVTSVIYDLPTLHRWMIPAFRCVWVVNKTIKINVLYKNNMNMNILRLSITSSTNLYTEVVFLYFYLNCPSYPANAIQKGHAIRAAIKKSSLTYTLVCSGAMLMFICSLQSCRICTTLSWEAPRLQFIVPLSMRVDPGRRKKQKKHKIN